MPPRVMLLEDDPSMLSLLHTLLQLEHFEVVSGERESDLPTLLQAIRRAQPDMILIDVHLSRANGLELLKTLRHESDTAAIPVIMASGMDMAEECLRAGANAFVLKPFLPDELIRQMRQVLAGRRSSSS